VSDEPSQVRDELAAYALDALEPSERQRVAAALSSRSDVDADQLLAEYQAVRDLLPYGLAAQAPPAGARARLLQRARGGEPRRSAPRGVWDIFRPFRWVLVAVALAAAALWNVQIQQQAVSIEARARAGAGIVLAGTGVQSAAARLYVSSDVQRAELAVTGLPPLRPDRTYQLWFARPGQPTETGGAFRVDDRGQALVQVVIPVPLNQVNAIAVTEEPMPASLRPTGQHLLDGRP
jgi:anti-sigma-K factor RskA